MGSLRRHFGRRRANPEPLDRIEGPDAAQLVQHVRSGSGRHRGGDFARRCRGERGCGWGRLCRSFAGVCRSFASRCRSFARAFGPTIQHPRQRAHRAASKTGRHKVLRRHPFRKRASGHEVRVSLLSRRQPHHHAGPKRHMPGKTCDRTLAALGSAPAHSVPGSVIVAALKVPLLMASAAAWDRDAPAARDA